MPERRPFPPSPRRLALARASGLTAVSPLLVGAAALVALIAAVMGLGRAAAAQLGSWIARAAHAADGREVAALGADAAARAGDVLGGDAAGRAGDAVGGDALAGVAGSPLTIDRLAIAVLELALPLVAVAALAALVVHVTQTRALWLPRRRIPGAPTLSPQHVSRTAFDSVAAIAIGAVAFGWLWLTAPQLASLIQVPSAAGLAIVSLFVALAIAWVALAVIDALVRRAQLASALAMSREEKREDDRLAAADPRWRAQRLAVMRGPSTSDAVARAAVVLLGDDVAVAIDWDPVRQPVPLRSATGRRAHATQLVGLARRHRVAVHRDAELTALLVANEGPVPDAYWSRLAEIVAAVRRA